MVKQKHVDASLPPMIIVVILSTCFVAWCFWIGTVCVRLWFYKGSLGPEPEKFIIIPQHRKERVKAQQKHNTKTKRMTVFPVVKPELTQNPFADNAYPSANPFADDTYPAPALPQPTGSHVAGSGHYRFDDGLEGLTSLAEIKKVLAEEHRISRLPTFEQDDCGDGSHFPDVPYAYKSTSLRKARRSSTSSYNQARELLTLRLEKIEERNWLKVDNTYIGQWEARRELLAKSRKQCIQTRLDGEYACEELMKAVTNNLAENYPHYFKILDKGRTKHIKSDVTGIQYPLKRPFTFVPIEVCTRVAVEDFNVFVRDDFTQQWYL